MAEIRTIPQAGGPDAVYVLAETNADLEAAAAAAGVQIQWHTPLRMLAACDGLLRAELAAAPLPVGGWTAERFSASQRRWIALPLGAVLEAPDGLFRFKSAQGSRHLLKEGGGLWQCDAATGKYRILRGRRGVLRHSRNEQSLRIDAACRPPALIERALVLSSGKLPAISGGDLVYADVGTRIAQKAAAVLGQHLSERTEK